jgi:5-methylcytosine-specific restriction endonuclease McrA
MASREYTDYLNSSTWQVVRSRQMARDGYRCRICHSSHRLQVHHNYYTRDGVSILGKETPADLMTLCEDFHVLITHRRQQVFGTGPRRAWIWWAVVLPMGIGVLLWLVR